MSKAPRTDTRHDTANHNEAKGAALMSTEKSNENLPVPEGSSGLPGDPDAAGKDAGFSDAQLAELEQLFGKKVRRKRRMLPAIAQRVALTARRTVLQATPPDEGLDFDQDTVRGRLHAFFARSVWARIWLGFGAIAVAALWCATVLGVGR